MAWQTREQQDIVIKSLFRNRLDTSSFGSVGHVAFATDGRRRGLVGYRDEPLRSIRDRPITPITDAKSIDFMTHVLRYGKGRIAKEDLSRITVRTLINPYLVNALRDDLFTTANVEAVIPVNERYSMVYMGYNTQERQYTRDVQNLATSPMSQTEFHDPYKGTYSIGLYSNGDRSNSAIFSQEHRTEVANLLRSFGHTAESAARVMNNPHALLGVIHLSGTGDFKQAVVGICIAERVTITLNTGEQLRLVEITDAKILERHQGNGLYYELSTALINDIIRDSVRGTAPTDLVFAESNVQNPSLIKTALLQGRHFTGMLSNHVSIDGNLKDFAVTYLQGEALRAPIKEALRF
ncbi:MAG: hypothetical protein KGH74_00080 [Candidatus Micrarchaeota archaeon]|nr:hypothetical protein [Candidatus Micrarchaeota archaeon]